MEIKKIQFCPVCGSQDYSVEGNCFSCPKCDTVFYENPASTACVVFHLADGRVILSERGRNPHKGKYDYPGGFVEMGETAEQAIVREVREELAIEIDPQKLQYLCTGQAMYPFGGMNISIMDTVFTYALSDDTYAQMTPLDDVAAIRAVQPSEITPEMCGFGVVYKETKAFIKSDRSHNNQ